MSTSFVEISEQLVGFLVADGLDLTVEEAAVFFKQLPKTERKLNALEKVGLGYLKMTMEALL